MYCLLKKSRGAYWSPETPKMASGGPCGQGQRGVVSTRIQEAAHCVTGCCGSRKALSRGFDTHSASPDHSTNFHSHVTSFLCRLKAMQTMEPLTTADTSRGKTCGICCQMLLDWAAVASIERWGAFSVSNEAAVRCCWRACRRRCTAPCPSILHTGSVQIRIVALCRWEGEKGEQCDAESAH